MSRLSEYKDAAGHTVVVARNHADAWRRMARLLHVSGPRTLRAHTDAGAEVQASLYDGEDYIADTRGRHCALPTSV